jgi:hypothetical protein
MGWVDAKRTMRVMANADNGKDAAEARRNGAQVCLLTPLLVCLLIPCYVF